MMKRLLLGTYACFIAATSVAQSLPNIPSTKEDILRERNIILLDESTIPALHQHVTGQRKKLNLRAYFGAFLGNSTPPEYRKDLDKVTHSHDEFAVKDAIDNLLPLLDSAFKQVQQAQYGLIPARVSFEKYNFDTNSFGLDVSFNMMHKAGKRERIPGFSFAAHCAGLLGTEQGPYHNIWLRTPCILVKGMAENPKGVFPTLRVEDQSIARSIRELAQFNEVYSMVLVKLPAEAPRITDSPYVATSGYLHLMAAEPVGLYVFNRNTQKLLASTASVSSTLETVRPEASIKSESPDNSPVRNEKPRTRLEPVPPTHTVEGPHGPSRKAVTITLE